MNTALWILAVSMMLAGVAGAVLPVLPGMPLIFGGVLLAAWIDDFQRIGVPTIVAMGILAAIGMIVDYMASAATAKRAGASRLGVIGAAIGAIAGVFTGFWGLLFMPLVGAAIGEFIARRDMLRAGKVGVAAGLGLIIAAAMKLAIAFIMIGVFVAALLL